MQLSLYHLIILFVLGTVTGSFINVVVYRFPRGQSVISPPSACPFCERRLGIAELIPLVSYILLGGRCRHCKTGISLRYFLVELATGSLFVAVPFYIGGTIEAAGYLFLLCLLLAISLIDIDFRRIPNVFLAVGLGAGIVLKLIDPAARTLEAWGDSGLGMLIGGGVMLLIYIAGRGGMGAGDLKLMIMVGFFLGMDGVLLVLFAGFILGGGYSLLMVIMRRLGRKDMIPFGPFLSLGVAIEIFFGDQLLNWYSSGFF